MSAGPLSGPPPLHRRVRGNPVPLAVYERLYGADRHGFLYESLEQHGSHGRHSFLGGRPRLLFTSRGDVSTLESDGARIELRGNPLLRLRELMRAVPAGPPLDSFAGGAVGYLGYDMARHFAPLGPSPAADGEPPDACLLFPTEVVIIDHLDEVAHIVIFGEGTAEAERRADAIAEAIAACEDGPGRGDRRPDGIATAEGSPAVLHSNLGEQEFARAVARAQRHIRAGDIYQVVLSRRLEFPVTVPALEIYRALRVTNPSPYMYYLNLDGLEIAGSSPEVLVKLSGRRVTTRPLAGTRPRGNTPDDDAALERDLLGDRKERAEHLMLVDLARNDLGRVCRVGSVRVHDTMQVERYARVMHLVTGVEGRLCDDRDAFDLCAAAFPAGTVSGAPKIRAMQIIDELEPVGRGPYAGAIGHFNFLGDMDLCIAIRTIVVRGGRGYLQTGAGIVADSVAEREFLETENKARGLTRAIRLAEASALIGEEGRVRSIVGVDEPDADRPRRPAG